MIDRWIIYLIMIAILVSLASAVFYFIRNKNRHDEKQIARALTLRIGLSFLLFLCLFIFYFLGWIQPHGLPF